MIVITAPTGNIGRRLLSLLAEAAPAHGEELRVVVRDPARLPEGVRRRVDVVTGSHGDAATVARAFAGAGPAGRVAHSSRGLQRLHPAGRGGLRDTADTDRRAPMVAAADIAAAAAGLLLERSWSGVGSVPVLGPRDLSPHDLARLMTEELGRPVRYERQSLDDLRATMLGHGLAEAFVEGMVDMKRAKDEGLDEGADRASRAVVPGTDFARWCARTLKPAVLAAPEATGGR
ncbi:NmrA family transcriptional regulator [Streptomyces sp. NPDC002232]|uniref:NmrA family transcriptional regulator n=1 Tax=Streptomyces sp. NPDC002232 TaxID=3364640 RepID=UPI0036C716F2